MQRAQVATGVVLLGVLLGLTGASGGASSQDFSADADDAYGERVRAYRSQYYERRGTIEAENGDYHAARRSLKYARIP